MKAKNKTILIVDDEEDTRIYFCSLLEDNGYKTIEAINGEDAHQKIKEERPDLVALDMSMPEKSGVRLYRDLKESEEYKDLPVIIVTGISDTFKDFISSRKQVPPPDGYMSKPIDPDKFLELVGELTG